MGKRSLSVAISVVLAFFFGYALTVGPVLRAGVPLRRALPLAFASDTASITVMEITDNAFILVVPGAIDAGLGEALFWWSLGTSLVVAFVFAFPVNRWLIGPYARKGSRGGKRWHPGTQCESPAHRPLLATCRHLKPDP